MAQHDSRSTEARTSPATRMLWLSMLCLLALPACRNIRGEIAQRASFELGCTVRGADVRVITRDTYGVHACECRAVYVDGQRISLQSVSGARCHATSGGQARAANGADSAPQLPRFALESTSSAAGPGARLWVLPADLSLEYNPGEDRVWVRVHPDGASCADFSLARDGYASGDLENGIQLDDMVALRSSNRVDLVACGAGFRLDEADRAELGRFLDLAVQLRDSRRQED